jgi:DNA-binding transcriptional MerR regulator
MRFMDQQHVVGQRRRKVSRLRREGLSTREISAQLATEDELNPKTQKPWSYKVIADDIKAMKEEASRLTLQETLEHRAEIHSHYQDLLRVAWEEGDLDTITKALKGLRGMLGTDAPQVIAFEQLQRLMLEAFERLEAAFKGEPETLERVKQALVGNEHVSRLSRWQTRRKKKSGRYGRFSLRDPPSRTKGLR